MTLKTYQARTMAEALAEVKRDLGRDAVILHTRSVRRGGLWGLWRRPIWEVTASPNINVPQRMARGVYAGEAPAGGTATEEAVKQPVVMPLPEALAITPQGADEPQLAQQMQDVRRMVEALLARAPRDGSVGPGAPGELEELHAHLIGQDVEPGMAAQIIRQVCLGLTGRQIGDRQLLRQELRGLLSQRICTTGAEAAALGGRARVIALIGPTGVGKTTTIAKLAANYKLTMGRRVGLITVDTYRIAAVDQLRTYADIIEVPLRAVLTAGELHEAVLSMRDLDVVLIDTAGRSQNNQLRLSELRKFLAAGQPDEVHLVVSATANRTCTRKILDRFLPLGANRLIVTKLDEAETFGVLLNVAGAGGGPLSYVTAGQGVPDDICRADAESLADCILHGRFGGPAHVE